MFENIIGQTNTITSLKNDITTDNFPPAILFHGPEYGSKLTTALEVARIISCKLGSAWNCACRSCEQHRLLVHPNLLVMGARDYAPEIAAASDVLSRTGKLSARYLFIRAVRKQLKAYDPVLWEGDATKARTHQQTIQDIEEALLSFMPAATLPPEKTMKTNLTQIGKLCAKLTISSRSDNIPINQVRNAIFWAHHSATGGKKIIILENADKMMDSSRNALLKILEEPPATLVIILITTNKGAIIRTILSRVRPYLFHERTKEESREVLLKIFREELAEFTTLKDYFQAWKEVNPVQLKNLAHKFIGLVLDAGPPEISCLEQMDEIFKAPSPREALLCFCNELMVHFSQVLHSQALPPGLSQMEKWVRILRDAAYQVEHLNLSPRNMLETIYFKFKLGV